MRPSIARALAVVTAVVAALTATAAVADAIWDRGSRSRGKRLHAGTTGKAAFSLQNIADVPAPVARYFAFALTPGQAQVRAAHFRQVGEFALRADAWRPFTAVQDFRAEPPAFVWSAKIRMAPLVVLYVRDAYLAAQGALSVKLAALFPVADEGGTPQLAQGELLRYLAEAPLIPTALLPGPGLSWEPIDATTARIRLTAGATSVSCEVAFGESGEIARFSAMRYRGVDESTILTPWVGHWRDYRRVDGMMIPHAGDVAWILPAGAQPYFRARIVEARFAFATDA